LSDPFWFLLSRYARIFFILFYFIGVLLFLNLVISFILDAYMKEFERQSGKIQKAKERDKNVSQLQGKESAATSSGALSADALSERQRTLPSSPSREFSRAALLYALQLPSARQLKAD